MPTTDNPIPQDEPTDTDIEPIPVSNCDILRGAVIILRQAEAEAYLEMTKARRVWSIAKAAREAAEAELRRCTGATV